MMVMMLIRDILQTLFPFLCGVVCLVGSVTANRIASIITMTSPQECSGVQYPGLGCFTLDPPFNNTNWLPQSPASIGLSFLLYTRDNPSTADVITAGNRSGINASHFDPQFPVKFIVHGFLQFASMDYIGNMTRALLNKTRMNVIVVSWGDGAGFPYARAVANTRVVGAAVAQLIRALQQVSGVTARQVHIIGHSLGAHVGGYAGALVSGLSRITGLDPAQPNYSGFSTEVRLDVSDARFVDVIHSDAIPYDTVGGYGIIEPIGHVDFYPNGGHHQPGCHDDTSVLDFFGDAVRNGITTAEGSLTCSHERSTELFTSSVILSASQSSCTFRAFPCSSEDSYSNGECLNCGNRPCPSMGLDADMSLRSRGVFYLNTTDTFPFCGHHYFVSLTLHPNTSLGDAIISVKLRGVSGAELSWRLIKKGRINGSNKVTAMIVDGTDLEEISSVKIKFLNNGNLRRRRMSSLVLRKVEVSYLMQFPKKNFCQPSVSVSSGQSVSLTSGTYDASECP